MSSLDKMRLPYQFIDSPGIGVVKGAIFLHKTNFHITHFYITFVSFAKAERNLWLFY
jgi:hypothetical protein